MTDRAPTAAPLLVVMGVSGSGKSTVGVALADRLSVPFADGDDFHPPANIAKMKAGTPLDDADREGWLDVVGEWLAAHDAQGGVICCSALKRVYRDQLRAHAPRAGFVHLAGSREVIAARQAARKGHFMPPALLESQFATLEQLEPDESGVVVDVSRTIDEIVEDAVGAVGDE